MKIDEKIADQIKASSIEIKKTADLVPYARNARNHEEWQVMQIAASIREYGFTNPILIDEADMIIAGHGRVMAALKLEIEDVPCLRLSYLSKAQKKAYAIADNKIALNSSWIDNVLRLELEELGELDIDLSSLGFTDVELSNLMPEPEELVEDEKEEWTGMPDFEHEDKTAFRSIKVNFNSQEHVDQFAEFIDQSLTEKTRSIWFPKAEIETMMDKRYES